MRENRPTGPKQGPVVKQDQLLSPAFCKIIADAVNAIHSVTGTITKLAVAFTLIAALTAAAPQPAAPHRDTAAELAMWAQINHQRSLNGAPPVTLAAGNAAPAWAQHLAETRTLTHAPNRHKTLDAPPGWWKLGEIVGRGQTPATVAAAFMRSPSHAAIITDPDYRTVHIGAWRNGTRIYIVARLTA